MSFPDMDARQGVACALCGDDPATWEHVGGQPLPVCDTCYDEQIEACAGCGSKWHLTDMERTFGTSNLYGPCCASQQPLIAQGRQRELISDERNGR